MPKERFEPDSPWHKQQVADLRALWKDDLRLMTDEQVWDWWEDVMTTDNSPPKEVK